MAKMQSFMNTLKFRGKRCGLDVSHLSHDYFEVANIIAEPDKINWEDRSGC
jgi:hypothetical protein